MGGCCASERDVVPSPLAKKPKKEEANLSTQETTQTQGGKLSRKKTKLKEQSAGGATIAKKSLSSLASLRALTPKPVTPSKKSPRYSDTLTGTEGDMKSIRAVKKLKKPISESYKLGAEMWREGETVLFEAEYIATNHPCVIKVKNKGKNSSRKPEILAEAELVVRLLHPQVVKTIEVLEDREHFYFILESFSRVRLVEFMQTHPGIEERTIARIMMQLFAGVQYCHTQNVILRNLSAESVVFEAELTDDSFTVKIENFEEAGTLGSQKVMSEAALGSRFVAPEANNLICTEKLDSWSCGIIMYYLICGEIPDLRQRSFSTSSPKWLKVSDEAKSLVRGLLQVPSAKRTSIIEALKHPWVGRAAVGVGIHSMKASIMNMSAGKARTEIKQLVVKFIIERVVKNDKLAKLAETFRQLDVDYDGYISHEELVFSLKKVMSEKKAQREAIRIFKSADVDGNGKLDYSEFLQSAYGENNIVSRKNLISAFNGYDVDGSGKISIEELKNGMEMNGEREILWAELMKGVDLSGDGEIDYEEFVTVMQNAMDITQ